MRSLILIIFIFVSPFSYGKTDWCEFNSDFAQEYANARNKRAIQTRQKRINALDQKEHQLIRIRTGRLRAKKFKKNWQSTSLSKKVDELFPGGDFTISSNNSGKVFVRPKSLINDQEYKQIVYDTSGDYFRIESGIVKKGRTARQDNDKTYLDIHNQIIDKIPGEPYYKWLNRLNEDTHFLPTP